MCDLTAVAHQRRSAGYGDFVDSAVWHSDGPDLVVLGDNLEYLASLPDEAFR